MTQALGEAVHGVPDPGYGGDDVVVDDGCDPALSWAGADDPNDPPDEVLGPDHEGATTVPRAGRLLAVTVASTQLILTGQTGSGLCLTKSVTSDGFDSKCDNSFFVCLFL